MTSPDPIAERYGVPSPWRRRALLGGCVALAVVFLGWLGWTAIVHASPEVESELVFFEFPDQHTATATVAVDRSDDDVVASCRVLAIAEDKSTVGELSWTPDGEATRRYEVVIRTERQATAVDLVGCTTDDQARSR